MGLQDEPIDPRLQLKLNALKETPRRDPQAAASGRADFLSQAQALVRESNLPQAVSPAGERRPIGWIEKINTLFGRKERSPMFTTLVSIMVVASMVLGGGGAAVFAAQDSLPGQALYSVKTLGEDLRLQLASGPQAELALELGYANRRVEEMRSMAEKGEPVSEPLEARYQQQMEAAYQLCANLDDAKLLGALEQVRQRLQEQDRTLQTLRAQGDLQAQAALDRVRERIRLQMQWVEEGLRDPQAFRRQIQAGGPYGPQAAPEDGQGWGPGECDGCDDTPPQDGSGQQYGPGQPSGTQAPGSSYGPGPGPAATSEPAEGNGYGYGPGPQTTGTSEPGSGYGPGSGDGTCDGCDSANPQDGTGQQYGPGSQQGPGDGDGDHDGAAPQDGTGQQIGPGSQQGPGDGTGSGPVATQSPAGSGDGTCDGCGDGPHHEDGGGHSGRP